MIKIFQLRAATIRFLWYAERQPDTPRAAARALQPAFQPRQWKVPAARPYQRLQVQFCSVDAFSNALHRVAWPPTRIAP